MRTGARLGAVVCLALAALCLRPSAVAGEDAPPGTERVRIAKLEPKDEPDGTYLAFEGTSTYPQGVVLACEVRYFGRLVPGAGLYSRVKKGRFVARVGPLPGRLLPGTYQAVVRFSGADQIRELFSLIADESDAVFTSDLNVGTAEEIRAFEQKYNDAVRGLMESIDALVMELDQACTEASNGKRWAAAEGLDRDASVSWMQGCEQRFREGLRTLDPFCDGAVPYRPDFTEVLSLSAESFHDIACARMKGLFAEKNLPLPEPYVPNRFDLPADLLEKQLIGEALQPVRDYLDPPKKKDR